MTTIRWHRRMQAHVALGVSLIVALSLGSALVATSRVVTRRALTGATAGLTAAHSAFGQLVDRRSREAAMQASLVTRLPVLRAHLTDPQLAGDAATLDALADEYRTQLHAAFVIVGSRRSPVIGRSGWRGGTLSSLIRQAVDRASHGTPTRLMTAIDGTLHLVVAEPARFADEVLGTILVGYALDDAMVRELARITRSEVNLVVAGRLSASSLQGRRKQDLAAMVRADALAAGSAPEVHEAGPMAYVTAAYPLTRDDLATTDGHLVLLQDWEPTRQSLRELRWQLGQAAVVIFAAALAGALLFSGRVTRALADISRAASETAAGDWTRRVPEEGSAEVQLLARTVNEMATNLHRHHAEVEAQRLRVFRATMTTVHDLVNNFLANMQLIRLEGEGRLPQETLDLFDQLIEDNAAELRLLGELQVVREKEMAVGLGIDYRTHAADAAPVDGATSPRADTGAA